MKGLEIRQILADNIKRLRKQRGLSQLKLANELDIAMTFVSDIENCKKWVSPETLAKLVSYFDVPVSELFDTPTLSKNDVSQIFIRTLTDELHKTIEIVGKRFDL